MEESVSSVLSPSPAVEVLAELTADAKGGGATETISPKPATVAETHNHAGRNILGRHNRRKIRPRISHFLKCDREKTKPKDNSQASPPKRGETVKCSLESLLKSQKKTHPEFDSLEAYGVDDEDAKELRTAEASRLHAIVTDPTKAVMMKRTHYLETIEINDDAYRRLSEMSQTIMTALSLCLLDNECVNTRSCKVLAKRKRLEGLVAQALVASKADKKPDTDEDDPWLEALFSLVDYISAVMARLISQTATGTFWLENILTVLVARITKIKYLLIDIVAGAGVALATGNDALEKGRDFEDTPQSTVEDEEECDEALRMLDANTKNGLTTDEEANVALFCIFQNMYRYGLDTALKYILQSLRVMNLSGLPVTTYEMCVVAYQIGFEDFKTVLYQDRDLEYSASSDFDVLNTTQSAMVILDQVLCQLYQDENRPSDEAVKTVVEWRYSEVSDDQSAESSAQFQLRSVPLNTMANIVMAMVPLAVTSPILLSNITIFQTEVALIGGVKDVVQAFQGTQFSAFCRLYTKEFETEAKSRDVLRLSEVYTSGSFSLCQLVTDGKRTGRHWPTVWKDGTGIANAVTKGGSEAEAQKKLDNYCQNMDRWVIDRTSVTIPCQPYVSVVMFAALVLIGGGLGLGFTLGRRISGVDPFNLANYTWALAAFIILVCKAIQVKEWAWSDFLRRRVRCRSVSELATTTGMNEQVIIAKLLHDDSSDTILQVSGPFNSVFRHQTTTTDGFSIDRPIHLATLTLSGLTLLKVVTPRGHAIVCLDHRRGTDLATVRHQGRQDKKRLVCDDVSRRIEENRAKKEPTQAKLHLSNAEVFKWKRVQGLYDFKGEDVVFM